MIYRQSDPLYQITEDKIQQVYNNIPEDIKNNVVKAYRWGMKKLIKLEGKGWENSLYKTHNDLFVYCLSRPEWTIDHVGDERKTGVEAIIRAILEYEVGFWNIT